MPGSGLTQRRRSEWRLAGLVTAVLASCAASWTGTYEGQQGTDSYHVVLTQLGSTVRADSLRVSLADQAPCELAADVCTAALAPDQLSFSAGACTLRLQGHPNGCTGAIQFDWRGTQAADNGSFVTSMVIETTLDDVPIMLQRAQPPPAPACGLGGELAGVLPGIAWLRRRLLDRALRTQHRDLFVVER